jgi:hypothetical protein
LTDPGRNAGVFHYRQIDSKFMISGAREEAIRWQSDPAPRLVFGCLRLYFLKNDDYTDGLQFSA